MKIIGLIGLLAFGTCFAETALNSEVISHEQSRTTTNITLTGDLAVSEWLPKKNTNLNITYSPICRSKSDNSQSRVRLLKDTNFLFSNLKAGDILFGVASFYQAKNYTIHSVAYCKPIFDIGINGRSHGSCLYDFNNDGVFDERSDIAYRTTKEPQEDFTLTKHQYPYEIIDFDGAKETFTTCVTAVDKTWTAQQKPIQIEKAVKRQENLSKAINDTLPNYENAKQKGYVVCVGEKSCKKHFQLTQIFITNNSDMKMQVATDTIIETYNPTELYEIGMKASKYPGKDDSEKIVLDVICKSEARDVNCMQKEIAIYEKFRPFIEMSLQ